MDLADKQHLYLGLSEKKDGSIRGVLENRHPFFKKLGLDNRVIVSAGQIHGNSVAAIDELHGNSIIPGCDALITDQDKFLLTITVADCMPVYFVDKNKKTVALAHVGWRGVLSGIAKAVVEQFTRRYNSDLSDIEVFVGPHIRDCHFEVKDDVARQFKSSDLITRNERTYVNLSHVLKDQLIEIGVSETNIELSQECTYCLTDKYFSFRRDNPKEPQTMVAYIGLV